VNAASGVKESMSYILATFEGNNKKGNPASIRIPFRHEMMPSLVMTLDQNGRRFGGIRFASVHVKHIMAENRHRTQGPAVRQGQ
jgi:hypothetical protein